jgi:flagellar biosynthesis/type III secretory pathway M-ring protein FliF/YscJ
MAQSAEPQPTSGAPISTDGFNQNDGQQNDKHEESWIMRDHHYVIIIVVVLVVVAVILYYIIRSVRGMRHRLARENEQQMQMLNQVRPQQPLPHQQAYSPIDERPVMMDGYKFDQYQQQQQQQQQPTNHQHRY